MTDRTRILRVDLTAGSVRSEAIPETWRERYLGGKGLGVRYLYEELSPDTDPLSPSNRLLVMFGPLTGLLPGEARYAAVTKSPLTGTFLDSYSGGSFPAVLAGSLPTHLGVLIEGQSNTPVTLHIDADTGTVRPAATWGKDSVETDRAYPEAAVAAIGPAGEHRVSFATIASDGAEHHAGRGGAGAVMGAKRLKAIVARGDPPAPNGAIAALHDRDTARYLDSPVGRWQSASGTVETVDFADETGVLATQGWQGASTDTSKIGIEAIRNAAVEREDPGPIPGDFRFEIESGHTVPRGATAMTLGAGLGISSLSDVVTLGDRCNRLGMDLIDAGNAIALAIHAADTGRIDRSIEFGDASAAGALLDAIAYRDDPLASLLADGVDAATRQLDLGSIVPTVKAMALPAYDPRMDVGMALAYATSDRGGCHRRARPIERTALDGEGDPADLVDHVIAEQNRRSLQWSLVADDFVGECIDPAEWLDTAGISSYRLSDAGERIWTLTRLFNVRSGFDRTTDRVPIPYEPETDDGPSLPPLLDRYYAERGWDVRGIPTRETIDRLAIDVD